MITSAKTTLKIFVFSALIFSVLSIFSFIFVEDTQAIELIENQENLWNIDEQTRTVVTWENVVLGQKYVLPFESDVSIEFTELPENAGKLIMKQVQLSNEEVRKSGSIFTVGYELILKDANSLEDLENGTFKYSLTLPKPIDVENFDVKYSESIGEIQNSRSITENIEILDKVYITNLDHFTIFIISKNPVNCPHGVYSAGECFGTVQEAIDSSVDGDEIQVLNGTYSECLILDSKTNISIVGQDKVSTVLDTSECIASGIDINQSSSIQLKNIKVSGGNTPINNIKINNSAGVELENLDFLDSIDQNVYALNSSNLNFVNLKLEDGNVGLELENSDTSIIKNISTIDNGSVGIKLSSTNTDTYFSEQSISIQGKFSSNETTSIFLNEANIASNNLPNINFVSGSNFSTTTSTTLVDNHSKKDITATGIAWGEISVSTIESRIKHDCNSLNYASQFCNTNDYPLAYGSVNYGAGIIISSPSTLGWNIEGDEESESSSVEPGNLPVDLVCGIDTSTNTDSISLVWESIDSPKAKYLRQIIKPSGEQVTGSNVYSASYFDFENIFDVDGVYIVKLRAFIDNDEDGEIDGDEYFSDFGSDCKITFDSVAPIITVDTLETGDPTPQLTGTVNDPNAEIKITVDGFEYSATNNQDGTWTLPNNIVNSINGNGLSIGIYDVIATATDTARNVGMDETSDELTILENNAPVVIISNPSDTAKISGNIDIVFQASDDFGMNFYNIQLVNINSQESTSECSDTTVYGGLGLELNITCSINTAAYESGNYRIDVTVGDDQDNITTESIIVSIDNDPPILTITPISTTDNGPALSGTVDDPTVDVYVEINGAQYMAVNHADGNWTIADDVVSQIADGTYDVIVTATDEFGNIGTDETVDELVIDTTNPVVTFKNINVKEKLTTMPDFVVSTKSEEIESVSCSYEGALPEFAESENNPLIVSCTFEDAVGNSGSSSYVLTVLNNIPQISISASPSESTIESVIELRANVKNGNPGFTYLWSGDCNGTSSRSSTPAVPGTYTCSVRVTDSDGDFSSVNKTVVVRSQESANLVPTVVLFANNPGINQSGIISVNSGTEFTITASVSNAGDLNYSYEFSDSCGGAVENTPSTTFASNPMNFQQGTYICRVSLRDANGDVANASVAINVIGSTTSSEVFVLSEDDEDLTAEEEEGQVQGEEDSRVLQEITETAEDSNPIQCEFVNKLSGFVYVKRDDNGLKNSAEEGIGNVEIVVNAIDSDDVFTVSTNSNGYWERGLCPGEYTVEVQDKNIDSRFELASKKMRTVNIPDNGDIEDVNFEFSKSQSFNWWLVGIPLIILIVIGLSTLEYSRRKGEKFSNQSPASPETNFREQETQPQQQKRINEDVAKQIFRS